MVLVSVRRVGCEGEGEKGYGSNRGLTETGHDFPFRDLKTPGLR
jgi:hypothetical protein